MSFIPGTLERGDGPARLRTASGVTLPVGETTAASGQPIEIGIRPEHYRLAGDGSGFPFEVVVIEPTGAETHVFGTIAGIAVRCVFRERVAVAPGEVLRLDVDPARVHVFDTASGVRL
jgi:multiple sugar transport system ATP-binding protein